jgi:hypothetical protein
MTGGQEGRECRAARNELVFRAVNEQILLLTERFRADLSDLDLVCECRDTSCTGTIRVSVEEFERAKESTANFVLLSGHEDPQIEEVVERNSRYVVVRKRGPAVRLVTGEA